MTRRALLTILGIAFVALVLFAVPLAVASRAQIRQEETLELERTATQAATSVSADSLTSGDPVELPRSEPGTRLAVYSATGSRRFGTGPPTIETGLRRALSGDVVTARGRAIAVAVPIVAGEQILGAMRAETPRGDIDGRVAHAWLLLCALGIAVLGVIAALGFWQARRLSHPLVALADTSRRLGDGDFTVRNTPTGVPEIDAVGRAFDAAAERVGDAVERERAFSADASHQLRTPLTGLRLTLERAQMPGADVDALLRDATAEVDRLDATVDELLALARDTHTDRTWHDVHVLLDAVEERWHGPLAEDGRPLRVVVEARVPDVRVSRSAAEQIVDALVDNAFRHGRGAVSVSARHLGANVIIDVSDEGPGLGLEGRDVFERRAHTRANGSHGIGLSLARRLAEAEGGRLAVTRAGPHPVFSLVLVTG